MKSLPETLKKFTPPFEYHCYSVNKIGVYWRVIDAHQHFVADVQITDEPLAYAFVQFLNKEVKNNLDLPKNNS
jgi:hypothetical protein